MKVGGLFEGIGGFPLAAILTGNTPVWSNEIDPWCCSKLRKNFTHRIIEDDIRNIGKQNLEPVDIITGGFPCQPFSVAGKRKGKEDVRHLWPENFRIIKELRPKIFFGENVTGIIGMALEEVLSDLESAGYETEPFIVPACAVGAMHQRNRVWIVAYSNSIGWQDEQKENGQLLCDRIRNGKTQKQTGRFIKRGAIEHGAILSDTENIGRKQSGHSRERRAGFENGSSNDERTLPNTNSSWKLQPERIEPKFRRWTGNLREESDWRNYWETEPGVGRVANGVSSRVDRIKGLGNAIDPRVAIEFFRAINKTLDV